MFLKAAGLKGHRPLEQPKARCPPCKCAQDPRVHQPNYLTTSAIVTAYNSVRYIGEALESVLRQTQRPNEILVVDDGSTDGTEEIARSFGPGIRYFYQRNQGEAAARNRAVALASADAIAFLDADDAWPPSRLDTLLARLTAEDFPAIVCGQARSFSDEYWVDALTASRTRAEAPLMSFGCSLIRRELFSLIGEVDVTMPHGSDLDWFLRCRERHVSIATIDEIVLLYRRHQNNMTNDFAAGRDGLMRTLKQSLDRRRTGNAAAESLPNWESLGREK